MVGFRYCLKTQQETNHLLDLSLIRPSIPVQHFLWLGLKSLTSIESKDSWCTAAPITLQHFGGTDVLGKENILHAANFNLLETAISRLTRNE